MRRQLAAAISRSAGVIVTCTSFSASAKVDGVTSGPTGGAVPKAGGAPGGGVGLRGLVAGEGDRRQHACTQHAQWRGQQELASRVHRGAISWLSVSGLPSIRTRCGYCRPPW